MTDTGTAKATSAGNDTGTVTPFRLEPPKRGLQMPQLVIGVLLIALGALVAVVLASRAAARDPMLIPTASFYQNVNNSKGSADKIRLPPHFFFP